MILIHCNNICKQWSASLKTFQIHNCEWNWKILQTFLPKHTWAKWKPRSTYINRTSCFFVQPLWEWHPLVVPDRWIKYSYTQPILRMRYKWLSHAWKILCSLSTRYLKTTWNNWWELLLVAKLLFVSSSWYLLFCSVN